MLDRSREALAVAASPIKLTAFGRAALCTSFSPESCRAILAVLRGGEPDDVPVEIGQTLLRELGTLPEQPHDKLRKVLGGKKNNQFQVKPDDLPGLIRQWLDGMALDAMFLTLPAVHRSSKQPAIAVWASGTEVPTVWDDDFDKFGDVVQKVFRDYIPWLMFACKQLSEIAGGWSLRIQWEVYASFFEAGADSVWAARWLRTEAGGERRAAVLVGRKVPSRWLSETDPLGLNGLRSSEQRWHRFKSITDDCINESSSDETVTREDFRAMLDAVQEKVGLE